MSDTHAESIAKVRGLIKEFRVAMLTTRDGEVLRSRPMATQEVEFDGDLWFMTSRKTDKVHELNRDAQVNVVYADEGKNTFVSVSGRASVVSDVQKQKELWTPIAKMWFSGPEDPDIVLVKINVDQAEYWDAPSGRMVGLFNMVKAMVTGSDKDLSENETVDLR